MSKQPTFQDLYTHYQLDNDALFALAQLAGVAKPIIDVMIVGSPVEHTDADKETIWNARRACLSVRNRLLALPVAFYLHPFLRTRPGWHGCNDDA